MISVICGTIFISVKTSLHMLLISKYCGPNVQKEGCFKPFEPFHSISSIMISVFVAFWINILLSTYNTQQKLNIYRRKKVYQIVLEEKYQILLSILKYMMTLGLKCHNIHVYL